MATNYYTRKLTPVPHARREPVNLTEADVVGELYYRLRAEMGLLPRLEYAIGLPSGRRMRADIAVVDRGTTLLIEVKKTTRGARARGGLRQQSTQAQKYQESGLPWTYCRGWQDIDRVLRWVAKHVIVMA